MRLGILDALLQNLLSLLDKLPMQINGIRRYAAVGVVLTEDKLRRLLVVRVHLATMRFPLVGKSFRARAIAALVGFPRLEPGGSDQVRSICAWQVFARVCEPRSRRHMSQLNKEHTR